MERKIEKRIFILLFVGAILILINGLWIASIDQPIVISNYPTSAVFVPYRNATYPITSIEAINATKPGVLGRITFGLQGFVEGAWTIIWIIVAVINLLCVIILYVRPEKHGTYAPLVILLSILSIVMGGGFMLGAVLGFIGGVVMNEWPKPSGETFAGRIIRAARLDRKFYDMIGKDTGTLKTATLTLIFTNILSGLGNGLYAYNAYLVNKPPSVETPFRILFLGEIYWDLSIVGTAFSFIGVAIIKWIIFSLIIYFVGVKLRGASPGFDDMARILAFAYVPISLQFFMPLVFLRLPLLWFEWPFTVLFITNLWMFIAVAVGLELRLDIPFSRAFGIAILAGSIYWLINSTFIIPYLNPPSLTFTIESTELKLAILSASTLIAAFFGAFTRH